VGSGIADKLFRMPADGFELPHYSCG